MGRLTGKVTLITGTAMGMGRAAALLFAQEGAKVVGCDLNVAKAEETLRMVREAGGEMISTAPVDLSNYEQTQARIDAAAAHYGGIDVLYNNASSPRVGPFVDLSLDDWHYIVSQ